MNPEETIIIEHFASDTPVPTGQKGLYQAAVLVYGRTVHELSRGKFAHLWHKDYFDKAADDYATHVCDELKAQLDKDPALHIGFLSYFNPHLDSPFFVFFLARQIRHRHPRARLILLTNQPGLGTLQAQHQFLGISNLEVRVLRKTWPIQELLKSFFISRGKASFIAANLLNMLSLTAKIIALKFRGRTKELPRTDILFFSQGFQWWALNPDGRYNDFYYTGAYQRLTDGMKSGVRCLTWDIRAGSETDEGSIFTYCSLKQCSLALIKSTKMFFRDLNKVKGLWTIMDMVWAKNIFFYTVLKNFLLENSVRAIIYYDETYISGKVLSLAANEAKIATCGFQHAIITPAHISYRSLRLFEVRPQLFPSRCFIYGPYTKRILSSYGYPLERLIPIGFDRISTQESDQNRRFLRDVPTVLFLRFPMDLFDEFYRNIKDLPVGKLHVRFHPGFLCKLDKNKFKQNYPDAVLTDSHIQSLDHDIRSADAVIGHATTALLNAIYQRKTAVAWLPHGLTDYCDLKYWGAQAVDDLKTVDWGKPADPSRVTAEISPEADIVSFFTSQFKESIS